jgi:hypothetical protein
MRAEASPDPVDGLWGDVLVPSPGPGPLPLITARLEEAAGIDVATVVSRHGAGRESSAWTQIGLALGGQIRCSSAAVTKVSAGVPIPPRVRPLPATRRW